MMSETLVMRRYTFKLYPTATQSAALLEQSRMVARLWNAALEEREQHWRRQCQMYGAWETESYTTSRGEVKQRKRRKTLSAMEQALSIKTLRMDDPAWANLNADTPAQILFMLDEAFKAFFKRAKNGAGASSGYPTYKRVASGMAIPFRDMGKGWRMKSAQEIAAEAVMGRFSPRSKEQSNRDMRELHQHQVETPSNRGASEGQVDADRQPIEVETPSNRGASEGRENMTSRSLSVETPSNRGASEGKDWRLYVKGISDIKNTATWIKMRGCFPCAPESIRDCVIMFRDGAWWLSVVVKMLRQRKHGDDTVTVKMNLIDEFARVERAKGECLACSKEPITTQSQQYVAASGADTGNLGGDDRSVLPREASAAGADTGNFGAEHITNEMRSVMRVEERADEVASARDTRFKKFSWRWRRETRRVATLKARAARRRKHVLHGWTTDLVSSARDITVVMPAVKESTASPRGNEREWGAAVEPVSALNRHVLNQAPALAYQLLAYKAEEAGIRCDSIQDEAPSIAIGEKLVAAGKSLRKAKRALKR